MKEKPPEKDILGRRGAAVAVVLLIGGPLFFLLWFGLGMKGMGYMPFGWTWHAPAIATVGCAVLAYFMPEKLVDFTGRLVGSLLIWWAP